MNTKEKRTSQACDSCYRNKVINNTGNTALESPPLIGKIQTDKVRCG